MTSLYKKMVKTVDNFIGDLQERSYKMNYISNKTMHKYIMKMKMDIFENTINMLTGQISPEYAKYYIYSLNYKRKEINVGEYYYTFKGMCHNRIDLLNCQKRFELIIVSPESFKNILILNNNNKYIFLPLTFMIFRKEFAHQACLIYNTKDYTMVLFDPNGNFSYFDNSIYNFDENNTINSIDRLIQYYCAELNGIGINVKYITLNGWNPNKNIVNRHFPISEIGHGHCVIAMLIIIQLLANIDFQNETFEFQDICDMFSSLKDDELLSIINNYTIMLYSH